MSETYDVMKRLRKVKFEYGMSSLGRMAAIGRAILPGEKGWMWTTDSCEMLKNKLISLLESAWSDGFDDGFASADDWCAENEDAMHEHGWVRIEDETCEMHSVPIDSIGISGLRCSKCGHETFKEIQLGKFDFVAFPYPRYCPHCGRKVCKSRS